MAFGLELKQARQLYAKKRYTEALAACRKAAHRGPDWDALVDEICMHGAATGNIIGFDGRVLRVQAADPATAWMGQQAPQQPLASNTFSSIVDALEAAADGDTIQLMPGTHVTSQVCLSINKRVLLEGVGTSNQQVVLDHRANHPVFNITRCCILRCFSIDMVGFCEAVAVSSSACIKPILQQLHIACSGDDGLSVGGSAQPLLHNCTIQVRRCGIKQCGSSSTTLWHCSITAGSHGLMACGSSQAFLEGCKLEGCGEDGIVGLQQAGLHLTSTTISGCKGPGIDLCDESTANLKQVDVTGCCGGVWLWQSASCEAVSSYISGGSSYAVLLDAQAYARGSSCTIDGPCHDSSEQPLPDRPVRRPSTPSSSRHSQQGCAGESQRLPHQQQLPQQVTYKQPAAAAAAVASAVAGAFTSSLTSPRGAASSSPFSTESCSEASSHDVMVYCSRMGSSEEHLHWQKQNQQACYSSIVNSSMLVEDGAAAAALFPPETGPFAVEQPLF